MDGSPLEYPTLPGYATKQTSGSPSDKYELSFPYLDGKKLTVTFSPLHGKGKGSRQLLFQVSGRCKNATQGPYYREEENNLLHIICCRIKRRNTSMIYEENKRERLSGISSAAAGLIELEKNDENFKG